ncbi:MAG: cysteinyl-tRNA synthetase [Bogoriella megaspora]|nr:MAG: cysteinyl-tRNA synthetase [Bogoriella megaspora]
MPPAPSMQRPPPRSSSIAPWDNSRPIDYGYSKRDGIVDTSPIVPQISRVPPTASSPNPPWHSSNSGYPMTSSVFGSFYNDSQESIAQLSPGFRPSTGQTDFGFPGDDRRPSVQSNTTVSSSGSKSSIGRGFHKKLQGFFGEDVGSEPQSSSDSTLPTFPPGEQHRSRHRNNSSHHTFDSGSSSRPASPGSSRPRTPMASSEVTPWLYQDNNVSPRSCQYFYYSRHVTLNLNRARDAGDGLLRWLNNKSYIAYVKCSGDFLNRKYRVGLTFQQENQRPDMQKALPDIPRPPKSSHANHHHPHMHRLHLPGHRHTKSKEEAKTSEPSQGYPLRPFASREDSFNSLRQNNANAYQQSQSGVATKLNLAPRSSSPTPSMNSAKSREGHKSPKHPGKEGGKEKRSLVDRITRRNKGDNRSDLDALQNLGLSSGSLAPNGNKESKRTKGSVAEGAIREAQGSVSGASIKHAGSRLPFKSSKRTNDSGKDGAPGNLQDQSSLWQLDTDLSHMEGIIDHKAQPTTPPANDIFAGFPGDEAHATSKDPEAGTAAWDAPDSWAVKKARDLNEARLQEIDDETGLPSTDSPIGPPHHFRIFRTDSTFATLHVAINTTVVEIMQMMGRKTPLSEDLDNHLIVLRKHDTSRQLEPGERPLVIQKKLLLQAGYHENDRLDMIGGEDNSYLCRFTFLPAKMSGYTSLEKDPGFSRMQKFSHIDLQGRNLITIPITLYQKATEIISLNLSRNLSLDIPKDFIQSCTNLREIKYTGNEAWKLPPSLSLASRMTLLDVSNNCLEQLEHADLWRLNSLVSLRLANNKLSQLPKYFGQYKALRSLNIASNSITEFPEFLLDVKTLVDLDVSFNSMDTLPKIGQLVCLERLWATNNKLNGSFDPSMSNLVNLKEIDVRFNGLNDINICSQLPRLEVLMVGHNSISAFEGSFQKMRLLLMDHNPVTRFGLNTSVPSLSVLNLASAQLTQLPDDLFMKMPGLCKFILDKNHFVSLSTHFGKLSRLEHLSVARNNLNSLPQEIGLLSELRYLDLRENNLDRLPPQLWYAKRLETLNVSSNVLASFPKPGGPVPVDPDGTPITTPNPSTKGDAMEGFGDRRPSQASAMLSASGSPRSIESRKGSVTSFIANSRKPSTVTRAGTEGTITPISRKDSSMSHRLLTTFAGSLRHLILADNRLTDDSFDELHLLPELRILNLSYNELYDVPPRTIKRWQHLTELYLSGNDLTSLPAEDLEEVGSLKVIHINSNKFQTLPAELAKVTKLAVLDVGSNALKYNVSNWPYDWNWNWNPNLRYLNLSGNKRLEIKPSGSYNSRVNGGESKDLTDFTSLTNLRILGLMDVTLMIPSVPDQTDDRRVRTSGSILGSMAYGMADTLGRNEHLSTLDLVFPRYQGHDDETLVGMFDGQPSTSGGSKVAKFLHENFQYRFAQELRGLIEGETPIDALRRTYLALNKDLALAATQSIDARQNPNSSVLHRGSMVAEHLNEEDLRSGSVATVLYLHGMELFVSNVGDAQAILIHSEGSHRTITRKHDPAVADERARIRDAGGYVSRQGKLNDQLEVSRAFGFINHTPCVIAAPHISQITIKDTDEMIVVGSRELWDYLTPDFIVDVARQERGDLMRAAQKLRDLAIAFGATSKIMVMMLGVSDIKRKERLRHRSHSMSMGPSGYADEYFSAAKRKGRGRDVVADSKLARLDQEVEAPTGEVTLVFTDIKNSTLLWETSPIAMRSAIKLHNELMRRHLRIIGGYEVKTEGDAFMVAFPTVTSALLWCFTIQSQLLEVQWPQEILNSINGQEVLDSDGNVVFRGLSVRMGIHWGSPVCEVDPVTKRMDYFGPMVNRASRISSVADGGQITVSSDFILEIQSLLETHIETDRSGSGGSEESMNDDLTLQHIRRELRSLSSQGFEVKDLGERRLKGLENPEYIYLMYPHSLSSRLVIQQQRADAEALAASQSAAAGTKTRDSRLTFDTQNVWDLWNVSLRLEMLCSTLECPGSVELKAPETALLERMKNRGGEITDRFLINFVEHQISRIETCITTLTLRNLVRPFHLGMLQNACSMSDILAEVTGQLQELQMIKQNSDFDMAPA